MEINLNSNIITNFVIEEITKIENLWTLLESKTHEMKGAFHRCFKVNEVLSFYYMDNSQYKLQGFSIGANGSSYLVYDFQLEKIKEIWAKQICNSRISISSNLIKDAIKLIQKYDNG